ncbi:hypothetical protein G5B47_15265 [Paenibacillus sp. 7124]|uniref:Uncharacterized protein n=2 Tax=Paenibacillus TaxID=44249 RepID=A0A6M1PKM9_9BACL|nr:MULTISPECIES: hypothetical protein [Paenibacillus]AHV98795.1 hypothetical protein PSAB_19510 [Paenibacillus sabinae T27]NGM83780.1 hypothetical protein [Paenibacillus apii]NJJ41117.1 hypothetical protein [Paenibacillus apii]
MKENWIPLNTQEDIDKLINIFGGFHDACLKELYMWTEHYVDFDLSMSISDKLDTRIRALFQRQWENPSALELLFEEVTRLSITPSTENYDSIIYDGTLLYKAGLFYWADDKNWTPGKETNYGVNWIAAKKVSWREVSQWMGKQQRYGITK